MHEKAHEDRPGLGIGRRARNSARGRRHLLIRAIEFVAIDIDVVEFVISSGSSAALRNFHQWPTSPTANVVNGFTIRLERLGGWTLSTDH